MSDLERGIGIVAHLERAYRLSPPADWHGAVGRIRRLARYGDSVVHEAAHAIVAWHSPTCIAVLRTSVRSEDACVTTAFVPLIRHPHVLWDEMAFNLASAAVVAEAFPDSRPQGTEMDAATALRSASRLWARRETRHQPPPWTDYADIRTPDIAALLPLRVLPEQLPYLRVGWRQALAIVSSNLRRMRLLCGALATFGTLNAADLALILGRRPIATPLMSLVAHFTTCL